MKRVPDTIAAPLVRNWPAILFFAALLITWELAVRWLSLPAWLLPAPSTIAAEFSGQRNPLLLHSLRTLQEALLGLGIAFLLGVLIGTVIHQVPLLRRMIYPLLVLTQTIPLIVLAPLLVIWFGYGLSPKILVVVLACFFPIAVNAVTGLESTDPDRVNLLRAMGASRRQVFIMVQWPSALPGIFSGTRIAAGYAVMAAVVAEWMGSDRGLGVYIVRSAHSFLTARVFAGIALISVYSILLFFTVAKLERTVVFWKQE